jgi:uncharacterized protein (TIGR03067 family)
MNILGIAARFPLKSNTTFMKIFIITFILSLITFSGVYAESSAADDQKNLQGTWIVQSATEDGRPFNFADEVVFDGDKFTIRGKIAKEEKNSFQLDASKKPKRLIAIPLQHAPNSAPGQVAYELDGDRLKLVLGPPDKSPTEISDKQQKLIILKRSKP